LWCRRFGLRVNAVTTDSDNFIYPLDNYSASRGKYDEAGNLIWPNVTGSPSGGVLARNDAQLTGNSFVSVGQRDGFSIEKFDLDGNFLWSSPLDPLYPPTGGDRGAAVKVRTNGNVHVAGSRTIGGITGAVFTILDDAGALIARDSYSAGQQVTFSDVDVNEATGLSAVGFVGGYWYGSYVYLYDTSATLIKLAYVPGNTGGAVYVKFDTSGGLYVASHKSVSYHADVLDAVVAAEWTVVIPGNGFITDLAVDENDNVFVTASLGRFLKYYPDGTLAWHGWWHNPLGYNVNLFAVDTSPSVGVPEESSLSSSSNSSPLGTTGLITVGSSLAMVSHLTWF